MSSVSSSRATMMVSLLFAGGLFTGAWTGTAAAERAQNPYTELALFARVLTTIETDYVEEKSTSELVQASVSAMVDELDPHSTWMSPAQYERFLNESHGNYVGIGVELVPVELGIRVEDVLEGGPAARDGVLAGDLILAVDGVSAKGLDRAGVQRLLKGKRGETVNLTLERSGAVLDLTTVRDQVLTPSVSAHRLDGDIGYVRLAQFQSGSAQELAEAVASMDGITGLVLDVRDNTGGLLEQAVAVTDLFLDEGPIVSTRGRLEGEIVHEATLGGLPSSLRVALLVNGMTASASEILAGALQDTSRARLFGERTYGKGSVQSIYELGDGSAIKLTIGRYYTPSGEPVAAQLGRQPDVDVALQQEPGPKAILMERLESLDLTEDRRQELTELLEQFDERPSSADVPWDTPWESRLDADAQLSAAVDFLRG